MKSHTAPVGFAWGDMNIYPLTLDKTLGMTPSRSTSELWTNKFTGIVYRNVSLGLQKQEWHRQLPEQKRSLPWVTTHDNSFPGALSTAWRQLYQVEIFLSTAIVILWTILHRCLLNLLSFRNFQRLVNYFLSLNRAYSYPFGENVSIGRNYRKQ